MSSIPKFSTAKEVLDYYCALYDRLKAAQKTGSIEGVLSEEEEQWFIEMSFAIEERMNNSGLV